MSLMPGGLASGQEPGLVVIPAATEQVEVQGSYCTGRGAQMEEDISFILENHRPIIIVTEQFCCPFSEQKRQIIC